MLALIIIVVLLLLFLILPVGVDAVYQEETFILKAKAGPVRFQILPKKEKKGKNTEKPKEKKKKKPKAGEAHDTSEPKPKLKPGPTGFLELAGIIFKALSRFRRCLSLDIFHLRFLCAAADPYDAIMQYGYLNAGFSTLAPLLHRAFKIRDEEIMLDLDVMTLTKPEIDARIALTLQIWELFYIGFTAGFGFLRWFLPLRKSARKQAKDAKKNENKTAGAVTMEQKG